MYNVMVASLLVLETTVIHLWKHTVYNTDLGFPLLGKL